MKLLKVDIEAAFARVVAGEPVTRVANAFGVTEGALRWRFKREGCAAGEVRRAAWALYLSRMAYEALSKSERLKVDRLMANGKVAARVAESRFT